MSNEQLINDLNYATDLAKSGQEAPLVGGPFGLMWGVLLSATLTSHWAIVSGTFNLPLDNLWKLWIGFAVVGSIGSAILGSKVNAKPANTSTANKVEQSVWQLFSVMLGTVWVGIVMSMIFGSGTPQLFDFIVAMGFGGQGLAYAHTARMSHNKWLIYPGIASFVACAMSMALHGHVELYLFAGIITVFTVVLPSLKTMGLENAK
ncbi:MAG: hypothetical protein P8Q37_01625 [Porticoccaceae bacterium]|nr:hypothetical protein [Porticoccaceae bacterium]